MWEHETRVYPRYLLELKVEVPENKYSMDDETTGASLLLSNTPDINCLLNGIADNGPLSRMKNMIPGWTYETSPLHGTSHRNDTRYGRLLQRNSTDSESKPTAHLEYADEIGEERISRRATRSTFLQRLRNLLVIILAVWGVVDLGYRAITAISLSRRPSCNCGDTIEEAIANDCKYDSMAAAWLPPACRDDELNAEFEKAGPNADGSWTYYADENKTRVLSLEEVSLLPNSGGHFFTTHQWHLVHCAHYWKKMYTAAEKGVTIEQRYDNLMHIDHCGMMFLKRDPLDKIATQAGVALHSDVNMAENKKNYDTDHHSHDHDHEHDEHNKDEDH